MKTKEEVIKDAYEEHWENYKDIIDDNGWFTNRIIGKGNDIKRDILEVKFVRNKEKPFVFRPKSLQGIEYNNGWIRIKSEEDLPKEDGDYFVRLYIGRTETFYYKCDEAYSPNYFENHISHCQPIIKPKKPLY